METVLTTMFFWKLVIKQFQKPQCEKGKWWKRLANHVIMKESVKEVLATTWLSKEAMKQVLMTTWLEQDMLKKF